MNRRQSTRIVNREPVVVVNREGYQVKRVAGEYDLYVYGMYVGSFGELKDAEDAGDKQMFEVLRRAA